MKDIYSIYKKQSADYTTIISKVVRKYVIHFFKQWCLNRNPDLINYLHQDSDSHLFYFNKTLKLTTSAWGNLLSN